MTIVSARLRPAARAKSFSGIVAGFGARQSASTAEIRHLLASALAEQHRTFDDVVAFATVERKADHPAIAALAAELEVPVWAVEGEDLTSMVPNPSIAAMRHLGIASVAEATALAFGPLLVEKRRSANATCALSAYVPMMASSAATTVSTSDAGS